MSPDPLKERANELSKLIIGAAIEVHRALGPGLLEATYEACLCRELELLGIPHEQQLKLPVTYKGKEVKDAYRVDIRVDNLVLVEVKAVEKLEKVHKAQLMTYLRWSKLWLGLLVNFNVEVLRDGIKRRVCG
jgi:GxxExxY protein